MERRSSGPSRFNSGGRRPGDNQRPDGPRRPGADRPSFRRDPGEDFGFDDRADRPRRDEDAGPDGDRAPGSERPRYGDRREGGERPRHEDRREGGERPRYQDRPRYGDRPGGGERGERPSYGDRPRPEGGGGDRPRYGQDRPSGGGGNYRPPFPQRAPEPSKDEMIFGIRPVQEALLAGRVLERVFVQRGLKSPLGTDVLEAARQLHVPIQEVPIEKLNSITRKNHQGVIALLPVIEYQPLDEIVRAAFEAGKAPLIVVLDRVTDVRNFGSIARSAECMGVDAILVPTRGGAQINGDAVKTSAGALNRLPVCREPNLKDTLRYLREAGLRVVACTEKATDVLGAAATPELSGPLALILGSEEDGISPEYLRLADVEVKIPLLGQIGSLNVAVAAGVALFEVQRQRGAGVE